MAHLKTAFLILIVTLGACAERSPRESLGGSTMGTSWSVIYSRIDGVDSADVRQLIEAELVDINAALSTYLPDSEISRLNEAPGAATLQLSAHFAEVLKTSLGVGRLTDGAYDVTVGPLVELWGFGSSQFDGRVPPANAVEQALSRVGAARLDWDARSMLLVRPEGVRIDLSSAAKGYAVDRLSELLAEQGIIDSLVEIGGELRARGERPEGGLWRLAVESPEPGSGRFIDSLTVSDAAVATSGDYRNFFEVDGVRYSHLVDPRTGYPVTHDLVSVTVIHERCMDADALATALIVMGLDKARNLAEREGIAAHFVSRGETGLEVHYTPEFEAYRSSAASASQSTR